MLILCGLIRPTFSRRYMPLMRLANFSSGGVISWTPGPTRMAPVDKAHAILELVAGIYGRDAREFIAHPAATLASPQNDPYTGLCAGMLYLRDCYV